MKIYTKTGDEGQTSLFTGERIAKGAPRVGTYGAIDEANSALALSRAFSEIPEVRDRIFELQKLLPKLMADIASVNKPAMIKSADIERLEKEIDFMSENLPPIKSFVIPGDTKAGAFLDLARTITRRAERSFCKLSEIETVHEDDRLFLNRLSDYLFMLMRIEDYMAAKKSASEV